MYNALSLVQTSAERIEETFRNNPLYQLLDNVRLLLLPLTDGDDALQQAEYFMLTMHLIDDVLAQEPHMAANWCEVRAYAQTYEETRRLFPKASQTSIERMASQVVYSAAEFFARSKGYHGMSALQLFRLAWTHMDNKAYDTILGFFQQAAPLIENRNYEWFPDYVRKGQEGEVLSDVILDITNESLKETEKEYPAPAPQEMGKASPFEIGDRKKKKLNVILAAVHETKWVDTDFGRDKFIQHIFSILFPNVKNSCISENISTHYNDFKHTPEYNNKQLLDKLKPTFESIQRTIAGRLSGADEDHFPTPSSSTPSSIETPSSAPMQLAAEQKIKLYALFAAFYEAKWMTGDFNNCHEAATVALQMLFNKEMDGLQAFLCHPDSPKAAPPHIPLKGIQTAFNEIQTTMANHRSGYR